MIQRTTGAGVFLRPRSLVFNRRERDRRVVLVRRAAIARVAAGSPQPLL